MQHAIQPRLRWAPLILFFGLTHQASAQSLEAEFRPIAVETCRIYTEGLVSIVETDFTTPNNPGLQMRQSDRAEMLRQPIAQLIEAESNPQLQQALIQATSRFQRTLRPDDLKREMPAFQERCTTIQMQALARQTQRPGGLDALESNIEPRMEPPQNQRTINQSQRSNSYTPPPALNQGTLRR